MGWENRDYNRGGGGEYFGNPAAILSMSLPFGTWFGARVRLHFWMLLTILFTIMGVFQGMPAAVVAIYIAILIASVMLHEFGHRVCTMWVGGRHDEFMLWPAGGLIHPATPPYPWPMFAGHAGGIAANLLICLAAAGGEWALGRIPSIPLNPLAALTLGLPRASGSLGLLVLSIIFTTNVGIIFINLLPYYWFDAGYLLESILWPWTGRYQAINVTCIVGMVIAVPMFLFSLAGTALMGMIFWALLFASSFNKRRELVASGTGETEQAIAFSAQMSGADSPLKNKRSYWGSKSALKAAQQERRVQDKIDGILAKVHAQGMHSLTWFERRALKQATERQRRKEHAMRR